MNGSHRPLTRHCRHRHRPDHWTRRLTPSPPRVTEPLATLQSVLASLLARSRDYRRHARGLPHASSDFVVHAADCHHAAADFIALVARIARTRAGFAPRTSCMTLPPCVLHPPVCDSTPQVTRFHMIGRRMERRRAHIFAPLAHLDRPLPDFPREPSTCIGWSAGARTVSTSSRSARPRPRAAHSAPRRVESNVRTSLARSRRGRSNARDARSRSRTSAPDPRRKRRSQRAGGAASRVALRAPRHHRPRARRTPAGTRCAPRAVRESPARPLLPGSAARSLPKRPSFSND